MKKVSITVSFSGTIPTGQYANAKPEFSVTEEWDGEIDRSLRMGELHELVRTKFESVKEQSKVLQVESMREDIRFYQVGNERFPSVTSIIGWEGIDFPEYALKHYASRGTIVHKQIEIFLKTGKWREPKTIPGLKADVALLRQGFELNGKQYKLTWEDCDFRGFYEEQKEHFEYGQMEVEVVNKEHRYAGTADCVGMYRGKKAVIDFKTANVYDQEKLTKYFKQLSAYAKSLEGVETMVIVPLKPGNKKGYGKPIVSENIDDFFRGFLEDREAFRKVFGI